MSGIDWRDLFLEDFLSTSERQADGSYKLTAYPYGDGEAQRLMASLADHIKSTYERLISEEDVERWEKMGRVPVLRDGQRGYEAIETLTLKDLPAILDTFVVLEEERGREDRAVREQRAAERKERERIRAKERRKLKKLGEW